MTMRQCFCIRLNNFRLFPRLAFKKETTRAALPHSWLMNALFVLRPSKLWAFNIGHPCPSLAKGSWLAARLACFKYYYYSRHTQRPNLANLICRQDWGIAATNLSASAITSANNPSVTVTENSVLLHTSLNCNLKKYRKCCTALWQLPLHKGAKFDTSY